MSSRLESFVYHNRQAFDSEAPASLWEAIAEQVQAQPDKTGSWLLAWWRRLIGN